MERKGYWPGVALMSTVMIWSCPAAHAAAASDPCSLLTQPQVSAALAATAGTGQQMAPTLCMWSAPGARRVTLTLHKPSEFELMKMPAGNGITKTPVSGVGDEAVSGTTPGFATTLSVKKGSVVFVVAVRGFSAEQTKSIEKTLAMEILPRL